MKIKIIFLLEILLLTILTSCANSNSDNSSYHKTKQDLSNYSVANWSKYKAIGAGIMKNSSSREITNSVEPISKLVGITQDGVYETITFEDSNGSLIEQQMNLSGFKAFEKYTFFAFSTDVVKEIGAFDNRGPNTPEYVLYNPTGKIYSLDLFEDINLFTHSAYDESENDFFFRGKTKDDKNNEDYWIYELSVENNQLLVKKRINTQKINGWYCLAADRYGNLYSYFNNQNYFNYILTQDGVLKKLDKPFYKAMNNIVYELEMDEYNITAEHYNSKWINKAGNIETAEFTPSNYFYKGISYTVPETYNSRVLKKDNHVYYIDWLINDAMKIVEIVFSNNEKISYTYKEINIPDATSNYVAVNEKLYFLDNDKIFYINIPSMDGIKHVITSDYFFKTISADNYGNIYFTGVDSKLNDVSGIIDADDNVEVTLNKNSLDIVYINPLN